MTTELSPDLVLLIEILADENVLWTPFRHNYLNGKSAAAVCERRNDYRKKGGLEFLHGGRGSDRQAHHRNLAAAKNAKLIVTSGKTRPRVQLSDAADDKLRTLCDCYRVDQSWPILQRVVELTDRGVVNAGCVCEVDILGLDYDSVQSRDLVRLENQSLPLLVRGYLDSNSDLDGRLGYSITTLGRQALADGPPTPKELPRCSDAESDLFAGLFHDKLEERVNWIPGHPSLVAIPLGAGDWPEHDAEPAATAAAIPQNL
jgi:hypothetical protein